jgi:hypothetical protein
VPTAPKLEKWLMASDERPSAAFQDAMGAVLSRLWEIARSDELDAPFRKFKAKIAPVEFVYIGVLLYVMRHGYTAREQSRAAFILRRDIRKAHVDVRFNARVAAECWSFIDAVENGEVDIEPPASTGGGGGGGSPATKGKRKSLDSPPNPRRRVTRRAKKERVE